MFKVINFLFCSVLFCSVLFCSVLFCSVLFYALWFLDYFCWQNLNNLYLWMILSFCQFPVDSRSWRNIIREERGNYIIVLFVETPRKFINKFTWCFHKQNYYMFYRHAKIQRTYNEVIVLTVSPTVTNNENLWYIYLKKVHPKSCPVAP
jgi:hypothetical protein